MKIKMRTALLMYTAAATFSAEMAFAAIDAQALAEKYIAEGYTYVEVKQGPTQTKIEAIMDGIETEVIYDNDSGDIISEESGPADADDLAQEGIDIKLTDEDFTDDEDEDEDEDGDDDEDEDEDEDDSDEDDDEDEDDEDDSDDGDDGDDGDDN